MDKSFWVLGLTKSLDGEMRVEVLPSAHVLPRGVQLQLLRICSMGEEASRIREALGDESLQDLWGQRWHIDLDPAIGAPMVVAIPDSDDDTHGYPVGEDYFLGYDNE